MKDAAKTVKGNALENFNDDDQFAPAIGVETEDDLTSLEADRPSGTDFAPLAVSSAYEMRQGQAPAIPLGMLQMVCASELSADRMAANKMAAAGWDPAFFHAASRQRRLKSDRVCRKCGNARWWNLKFMEVSA